MDNVTTESFSIRTEVFEGPLDLLLDLVERRKLLINDISLAEVTDEYIKEVSQMQEKSLPGTTQFIQLAATLLLIKSKSLLPVLELTEEEEESIDDLEERLKLYQIYRDAALTISGDFGKNISFGRQYAPAKEPLFVTDKYTSLSGLNEAIASVLENLPIKQEKPKVAVKKVISLEDMIDRLHKRIENQIKLRFSELIEESPEKVNVIVGFLAVLESVKQGSILVAQANRFDEIDIEKQGLNTPSYY